MADKLDLKIRISAEAEKATQAIVSVKNGLDALGKTTSASMAKLSAASANSTNELSRLDAKIKTMRTGITKPVDDAAGAVGRLTAAIKVMGHAASALFVANKLTDYGKSITRQVASLQDIDSRLLAMSGSSSKLADNQVYLEDTAKKLHVSYSVLADNYSRLLSLQQDGLITGEQSRQLLEGLSNVSRALGASNTQLDQSFYGLMQSLSAGTVNMEDFKQLVEPFPGLFIKVAKAANMTTAEFKKLVSDGKVSSQELVGYLATAMQSYSNIATQSAGNINAKFTDISNAWSTLLRVIESPVANTLTPVLDSISSSIDRLVSAGNRTELQRLKDDLIDLQSLYARSPWFQKNSVATDIAQTEQKIASLQELGTAEDMITRAFFRKANDLSGNPIGKEIAAMSNPWAGAEAAIPTANSLYGDSFFEGRGARALETANKLTKSAKDSIQSVNQLATQKAELIFDAFQEGSKPVIDAYQQIRDAEADLADSQALAQALAGLKAQGLEGDKLSNSFELVKTRVQAMREAMDFPPELREKLVQLRVDAVRAGQAFDEAKQKTDELSNFAEQAARNMQDAFADFLFDPFKSGVKGMLAEFSTMIRRMLAEAAAAKLNDALFGKKSGDKTEKSDEGGWLGTIFSAAKSVLGGLSGLSGGGGGEGSGMITGSLGGETSADAFSSLGDSWGSGYGSLQGGGDSGGGGGSGKMMLRRTVSFIPPSAPSIYRPNAVGVLSTPVSAISVSVPVNVDHRGGDRETDTTRWQALGGAIKQAVQAEIVNQQRSGGLLAGASR